MSKIETFINDDYAALDVGDLEFYYGYESTYCSKHGHGSENGCEDCDDLEWCFVVFKKGKLIFKKRQSQLPVAANSDPVVFLLAGIGSYLLDKKRKK